MIATQRVCFVLQLQPDRVDDYLDAHTEVWPEMLDALAATGWRNYSLFLRPDDGLVVGYLETDDFERATVELSATAVNAKWQAHMAEYFRPSAGAATDGADPDTIRHRLVEYFHLA
ncbi:MAG TPA: L-rhamnose mutarotase [Aldersonia sp.]